ncbi:class IV adenylate cyclase [candidate division KSB1 bacterium]|nr:class IV adenylate cyclase [candidate division KSB1 bacterium]
MARNIEIKARIRSLAQMRETVSRLAETAPIEIRQDDTFFTCPNGRLKLRRFPDGSGELIFYRRKNEAGPKTSHYEVVPLAQADSMHVALELAYGILGRVCKGRTLYTIGRTRVHIDQVEGLGAFIELEVVLAEGESESSGMKKARELMAALGIAKNDLIDRAYVDLLNKKAADRDT